MHAFVFQELQRKSYITNVSHASLGQFRSGMKCIQLGILQSRCSASNLSTTRTKHLTSQDPWMKQKQLITPHDEAGNLFMDETF